MNKMKWKKFEELVAAIQKRLSPNAQVKHNDMIKGKSGSIRQVDVSIREAIGQYNILIAIECKDHKDLIDLPEIEKFIGKLQDISANKGAIVSASSFTQPAINKSKESGINLYRLVDVKEHEWQSFVSIPVLCDFRKMKNYCFKFTADNSCSQYLEEIVHLEEDHRNIILYDSNNRSTGKAIDFFRNKWDSALIPDSYGEHDVILPNDIIKLKYKNSFIEIRIGIKYSVEKELRLGYVPLEEFSGFHNVVDGSVITDGFTTTGINIEEVRKNWIILKSRDDLAIRPIITLTARNKL